MKINLSTYHILLLNLLENDNKPVKLDKLHISSIYPEEQVKSINEIILKFLNENDNNNSKYIKKDKILKIKHYKQESENIFYGEFLYGTHGTEHPVENIQTNEKKRKISPNETVLTPFYFYIEIIPNNEKGLLILENKNNIGIKVLFEEWFKEYVTKHTNCQLKLNLSSFVPETVINKFLEKGALKKIRFISYTIPKTLGTIFDENENLIEEGYMELKLQVSNKNKISSKIIEMFKNTSSKIINQQKIMPDDTEIDEIKLEIELDGSIKTFSINNLENTLPLIDITDDLIKEKNGHRSFESIHNKGKEYSKSIIDKYL